jgi:hypothetical protein
MDEGGYGRENHKAVKERTNGGAKREEEKGVE